MEQMETENEEIPTLLDVTQAKIGEVQAEKSEIGVTETAMLVLKGVMPPVIVRVGEIVFFFILRVVVLEATAIEGEEVLVKDDLPPVKDVVQNGGKGEKRLD